MYTRHVVLPSTVIQKFYFKYICICADNIENRKAQLRFKEVLGCILLRRNAAVSPTLSWQPVQAAAKTFGRAAARGWRVQSLSGKFWEMGWPPPPHFGKIPKNTVISRYNHSYLLLICTKHKYTVYTKMYFHQKYKLSNTISSYQTTQW